MNGIIVVNFEQGNVSFEIFNKINRLKEEFELLNVDIEVVYNDGTLAVIENGEIKISIKNCDFIIYLDKDKYLAKLLAKAGYRLFPRADFIEICDDKMLTHIALANNNIPMPKTYAGPLIYYSDKMKEFSFIDELEKKIGYPLVIKPVHGSLGKDIKFVNNRETFIEKFREIAHLPLIFQEYVSSQYGRSTRVMIIDHKILGAYSRVNKIDFRSNYGPGAGSEPFVLDDRFTELSRKIASLLDIEYAGIDFLFGDNGEPILCEINSNAFFGEFEKITKINVAGAFAAMIVDKVKSENKV